EFFGRLYQIPLFRVYRKHDQSLQDDSDLDPLCNKLVAPKERKPIEFKKKLPTDGRPLYLDAQATTPLDPRSEHAMEIARSQVADLIGCDPSEIIFTSGATESNNLAVKGVAHFYGSKKKHIITTQTEHKCILASCRQLEGEGYKVTYLPVNDKGLISLDLLEKTIQRDTSLVTIMAVNNEIGVTQPIKEIGVGAIYVRKRPRVRVEPIINGGGQERGLRSGTVPSPLVVGLGAACAISKQEMEYDHKWMELLSQRLLDQIFGNLDHVVRNGDPVKSYPGCINLSFAFVEGESLLMALKDVALSSGSACTSASLEPSYVLRAIGTDDDMAHSSIRFGFGRFTTIAEVDYTAEHCIKHVKRLREMSPLWEMVQEGIDLKSIKWSQH
ncbi:hypothetical protein L9F63_010836, partial [Diploptera punctata]